MSKQSAMMLTATKMARHIIAEQTPARLQMGLDAALMAAHEVFQLGPGRAQQFLKAYNDAMQKLAELYIEDCEENHDKQIDYAKGTRDALIRSIVGEGNFVPFDKSYGEAYMDELKRIRVKNEASDLVQAFNDGYAKGCEEVKQLSSELSWCRNELCLRCGNYREKHLGACDGCRWKDIH